MRNERIDIWDPMKKEPWDTATLRYVYGIWEQQTHTPCPDRTVEKGKTLGKSDRKVCLERWCLRRPQRAPLRLQLVQEQQNDSMCPKRHKNRKAAWVSCRWVWDNFSIIRGPLHVLKGLTGIEESTNGPEGLLLIRTKDIPGQLVGTKHHGPGGTWMWAKDEYPDGSPHALCINITWDTSKPKRKQWWGNT